MYQKIVAQNKTSKQGSLLAHEYTVINALRHGLLSFTELHYLDESKIKQPEHLTFIQAAKATWQHEKEKPCLDDILSELCSLATHEGRTEEEANLLADSFDITEADKQPTAKDVHLASQALRMSDSALLASNDDQVDGEELAKDADLISICSKSPIAQFASELAKSTQMPRNTTFLTTLATFSAVCSRVYVIAFRSGKIQPSSLYFCGEQPSGAAKSWVLDCAQDPALHLTDKRKKAISKELSKLNEELDIAEDKTERTQIKNAISALSNEYNALFDFYTDSTPEGLDRELSKSNGFFSIASAEQAAINSLLGLSYTTGGANKDLALKGYNGDRHRSVRGGRDGFSGRVVGSLCVIAQEGVIENILKASGNTGVIERFILWSEGHLLGKRNHLEYYDINKDIQDSYDNAMISIYEKINLANDFYDLQRIGFSVRSWRAISEFRQEVEPTLLGENSVSVIRGVVCKIELLILKVACILHVSIDQVSTIVHDDRVLEAIEFAKAYIRHIRSLMTSAGISMFTDREKLIIDLLSARYMAGKDITAKLYRNKQFIENGKASRGNVQKTVLALLEKRLIKASNKSASFNETNFTTC